MISFLGTGLLGANFTRALLNKGEKLQVWNRTAEKAKSLEAYGAKAFDRVTDAVRGANRIHLTLSDDQAVDDVLEQASPGFEKGAIIIDHTTTSAPVLPGVLHIGNKRDILIYMRLFLWVRQMPWMAPVVMLVSGDQSVVKMLEPELSRMTGKLLNLGEQPEKAAAMKLLGNLFHICLTGGIADLITLAGSLQIPTAELATLLELLNPAVVAQGRLKKITSNTFDQPSWELSMARKDARLMIEQSAATHKTLTVVPAVAKKMDVWLAKGYAKNDWTIFSKDPDEK